MTIKLIIRSTENSFVQEMLCEQSLITFGRSKSCSVTLEQAGVNRQHFIIRFTEGQYVIIDEGSTSGTILDGVQIDAKNCYQLSKSHEIIVPGFIINLENDNKPPRQERTTVMARKLMDKLFNDVNNEDHTPRLSTSSKNLVFYFNDNKASFVLGTLDHCDFVVPEDSFFAKEHISFIRDIAGVRIIPILNAQTLLNSREITEAEILHHNDKISIGPTTFVYQDYPDDDALIIETPVENIKHLDPQIITHIPSGSDPINKLDRLCLGLLVVTLAGILWILANNFLS